MSKKGERNVLKDERNRQIVQFHKRGWTYAQIGQRLSISPSRVRQIIVEESYRRKAT